MSTMEQEPENRRHSTLSLSSSNARLEFRTGLERASERREKILEASVTVNAQRVQRAKAIARKTREDNARVRDVLAAEIAAKQKAADDRREEILLNKAYRATRQADVKRLGSEKVEKLLNAYDSKLLEAMMRRENEFERRRKTIRIHLRRVRDRCDQLRMVRRMQAWWRRALRYKRIVSRFMNRDSEENLRLVFGPLEGIWGLKENSLDKNRQTEIEDELEFETLVEHISSPNVVEAAGVLIESIYGNINREKTNPSFKQNAVRSFLAALMITCHSDTVLAKKEDQGEERLALLNSVELSVERLISVCKQLLESLTRVRNRPSFVNYSNVVFRIRMVRFAHLIYSRILDDWKQADAMHLADEMQKTYVQIHLHLLEFKDIVSGAVEEPSAIDKHDIGLKQHISSITEQIESIKKRVSKLLGSQKFTQWLQEADQIVLQSYRKEDESRLGLQSSSISSKNSSPGILHKSLSGDSMISMYQSKTSSAIRNLSNEQIILELVIDPSFRLPDADAKSAEVELLQEFSRELEEGNFEPFLEMIRTIQDKLGALTPRRNDLLKQLDEQLDTTLLLQMLENKAFTIDSLHGLMEFIGERILALQAPERQKNCEAWLLDLHERSYTKGAKWTELAPRCMERALQELALIDSDMANLHLHQLAMYLEKGDGVSYLKNKLQQRLEAEEYKCGPSGMPEKTEAWMQKAYLSYLKSREDIFFQALDASEDSAVKSASLDPPTLTDCLVEGWVAVLFDENIQSEVDMETVALPETLSEFGAKRIFELHQQLLAFSTVSVIHIIISQVFRAHENVDLGSHPHVHTSLLNLVVDTIKEDEVNSSNLVDRLLPNLLVLLEDFVLTKNRVGLSLTARIMIETMLKQSATASLSNTVRRQLRNIVRKAIKSSPESCELLFKKISLDPWEAEIIGLCEMLSRLFELNQSIYSTVYRQIYPNLERRVEAE